jgi:hypothetical protein
MKKQIFAVISVVSVSALIFGCTNPATPASVAERLEYNLNSLSNTIKSLDTIDNNYLANPDVSPTISKTTMNLSFTPNRANSGGFVAAVSTNLNNFDPFLIRITPDIIANKKVLNENLNYKFNKNENKNTSEDNVNIDKNDLEKQNDLVTNKNIANQTENTKNLNAVNNNNTTNNAINNVNDDNNSEFTNTNNNITDNNTVNNDTINNNINDLNNNVNISTLNNNENLNTNNENTDAAQPKTYVYRYKPRYVKTNNATDSENLNTYMNKVENLYTMTNDAMEANTTLTNCKDNLNDCIQELRQLAINMKMGTYVPNAQQAPRERPRSDPPGAR